MKDWTGYVTYVEYLKGTTKGASKEGELINGVFGLGNVDKNYTSNIVIDSATVTAAQASAHKVEITPVYTPTIDGTTSVVVGTKKYKLVAAGSEVADTSCSVVFDESTNKVTVQFASADTNFVADAALKLGYHYDNIIIPQDPKKLPTLNMVIRAIPLVAKARRIVINYAQIAQFQAQTEYGLDMNKALAEQATAELQYEIDTEIVEMLRDAAPVANELEDFTLAQPIGVSKQDHFATFAEWIDKADQKIYDITKKFQCTYMIAGSAIKQVLRFCPEWKPVTSANVVGPYFAGTLGHIKVFITPSYDPKEFVFGVNGNDLMTSAAVYAPYLAVIPTQLLQTPDGATAQGFSTVYDAKIINENLLCHGKLV